MFSSIWKKPQENTTLFSMTAYILQQFLYYQKYSTNPVRNCCWWRSEVLSETV